MDFLTSLEETLKKTLVPDSGTIKAAEKALKELYTNPSALASLVHILAQSEADEMKQLAAVEARKLVISQWDNTDNETKGSIRQQVLSTTFGAGNKLVRHSCARLVAAIAEQDLDKGTWPDLLPTLVGAVREQDVATKEMASYALFCVLETQVPALGEHLEGLLELFKGLLGAESREMQVNAVMALDAISSIIEEDTEVNPVLAAKFKETVPGIVGVLQQVISADDESSKKVFNVVNNLIFLDTRLVGDQLLELVQLVAEIAANAELGEEQRTFALSFLISAVSFRKSKIASHKLGPVLTRVALRIACEEVDVDEELTNEHEEGENEESEPPQLALRLLAVLAAELAPSQVVSPLFEELPGMLSASDKFQRRGGLLSIGVASSGCPDYFSSHLETLVPALTAGLKDAETVVRVAALKTLTQLTSELQDALASHHEQLLAPIIDNIDSAQSPVAYKFGCFALDGLIEYMSHEAMGQYVAPLMNKLFHMLEQTAQSSILRSAIVSAIGSTAFASGKGFTPYFNTAITALEPLLANVTETEGLSDDDIELKAMTFENISTMARAVGSEAFSAYAKPLIEVAYAALSSEQSRIREAGFAFISNMAKVYGAEFAGFLEQLVPEILRCLEQDEFSFDAAELDEDDDDLSKGFNVNTGITIEKEIASVALAELATGTGKDFAPYVEPVFKVLAEQIDTSYGMREAAMQAMFRVTKAMFGAVMGPDFKAPRGVPQGPYVDSSVLALIQQVRDIAVPLLAEEFELTMVARILDGIADQLFSFGAAALIDDAANTAALESVCVSLMNIIKREHPCQVEDEEGPADEEAEDSSETDALLYESASEVLVNLALALESDFNRIFASFKDPILAQLQSRSKCIRVSATGSLAEIAAGLKNHNKYEQELMQVFLEKLANDESFEVRGNCAYGVGLIVQYSANDLSAAYQHILPLLFSLLDGQSSETRDVLNRTRANALGCVARLALKHPAAVPLDHVLDPVLAHLPLETGFEENVPIFDWIVSLYEAKNELIQAKTQVVLGIFQKVFKAEEEREKLMSESTLGREENADALKQFQKRETRERVEALVKQLA